MAIEIRAGHGWTFLFPFPRNLYVRSSPDAHKPIHVSPEFRMLWLHQVLSNERHFPICSWPPAKPQIGRHVRFYGLRRQCRNVTKGCVKFELFWKIEERLEYKLVMRARTVVGNCIEVICKARFVAHV